MTTPNGPRRRRQPTPREIRAREINLEKYLPPETAHRIAPKMPVRDPRTVAFQRAMRRRVRDKFRELIGESTWNEEIQEYVHPDYGIMDYQEAKYAASVEVETMIFTGDTADMEKELHALVSP